jgi:hypothetical protein
MGRIENDAFNNSSVCIRYQDNVSSEPLPSNDREGYTDTHTLTQTETWSLKPTLFFQNMESRLKTDRQSALGDRTQTRISGGKKDSKLYFCTSIHTIKCYDAAWDYGNTVRPQSAEALVGLLILSICRSAKNSLSVVNVIFMKKCSFRRTCWNVYPFIFTFFNIGLYDWVASSWSGALKIRYNSYQHSVPRTISIDQRLQISRRKWTRGTKIGTRTVWWSQEQWQINVHFYSLHLRTGQRFKGRMMKPFGWVSHCYVHTSNIIIIVIIATEIGPCEDNGRRGDESCKVGRRWRHRNNTWNQWRKENYRIQKGCPRT